MPLVPFKSNLATKQAYDPFNSLRDEMDKLFDTFFTQVPASRSASSALDCRVDVSETEKEIRVKAEMPGVDEKDIDVQLHRDILTIRGEKRQEKEENEPNYHLVERSYGSFARSIRLPFEPEEKAVKAQVKHGVLTLTIDKPAAEKAAPKKISVKAE